VLLATTAVGAAKPVVVGSKKFTESYVLGGIAKTVLERAGFAVQERAGMGGTIILWQALRGAQIDVYPEYTGTIGEEILKSKQPLSEGEIRKALAEFNVGMSANLGFDNTYALVMRRSEAGRLDVRTISDLRRHPELKVGLTHEFLDRKDGWRPLAAAYRLTMPNVSGIDHAIGYAALVNGSIDVKDAYSTDAKIQENDLVVLRDDLHFFPGIQGRFSLPAGARSARD
jgi:osmoprotectant transport system permease protein